MTKKKLSAQQRRAQGFIAADRDRLGFHNDWHRTTPFVMFDPATGRIRQWGTMSLAGLKVQEEEAGWHWLPLPGDGDKDYVDVRLKVVRRKTPCPAVVDGTVLRNLPVPCRLDVHDPVVGVSQHEVDEAEVALEFDTPGTYTVRVVSAPHMTGEYTVEVA